ncbi:unnamed protein product, partial [Rotaria sp. Silwood1]
MFSDITGDIEKLLEDFPRCFSWSPRQQLEDPSIIKNISPGAKTTFYNKQNIRLEIEPALQFLLRPLSDFVSIKNYLFHGEIAKPKNKKAKAGYPVYFSNRNNKETKNARRSLTLLISTMLVFGKDPLALNRIKVEICIVTRTINGCIYINPYYKFYKLEKNKEFSLHNPMFIHLGKDEGY